MYSCLCNVREHKTTSNTPVFYSFATHFVQLSGYPVHLVTLSRISSFGFWSYHFHNNKLNGKQIYNSSQIGQVAAQEKESDRMNISPDICVWFSYLLQFYYLISSGNDLIYRYIACMMVCPSHRGRLIMY
jgi:hypothetical protein